MNKTLPTSRSFVLPIIGSTLFIFQQFIDFATIVFLAFLLITLLIILIDFFALPHTSVFSFSRRVSPVATLQSTAEVTLLIYQNRAGNYDLVLNDTIPPGCTAQGLPCTASLTSRKDTATAHYTLTHNKRGLWSFTKLGVCVTTPIGFLRRIWHYPLSDTIEIVPHIPHYNQGLFSKYYHKLEQNRPTPQPGAGSEYSQLREYRAGDDRRWVHWRRSAARGKLCVKEFEPHRGQTLILAMDCGRLMNQSFSGAYALDWVLGSALAVSREALSLGDSVGIVGFSNRISTWLAPDSKHRQLQRLVRSSHRLMPQYVETDFRLFTRFISEKVKRQSVLLLYTDLIDPLIGKELARAISYISRRHRVIVVSLKNPQLYALRYAQATDLQKATTAAFAREAFDKRAELHNLLRKSKVDFIEASPHNVAMEVINDYIKRRWG